MRGNIWETKWLTVSITLTLTAVSISGRYSFIYAISIPIPIHSPCSSLSLAEINFAAYVLKRKWNHLNSKIEELEASLKSFSDNCASERQGRIRAQQALRKEVTQSQPNSQKLNLTSYPMMPIGVVHSCFSTRNGTPRQPLLVPLARACLVFNTTRVPPASLEGLEEYSHCWILYVFHLNTDLDKLWKHPSKSGFKAKVRVPRLKGGRKGVFATRSPHRPCPIGLTVAKVEAVQGNMILLSGVDLVDGTPVLDIKPYLPYCDNIQEATVPNWLMEDNLLSVASVSFSEHFTSALKNIWIMVYHVNVTTFYFFYLYCKMRESHDATVRLLTCDLELMGSNPRKLSACILPKPRLVELGSLVHYGLEKKSLYASPGELQSLIKQVLSWDIRSLSQRNRPHDTLLKKENDELLGNTADVDEHQDETTLAHEREQNALNSNEIIYHLILEGLDVSYRIDHDGYVIVEKISTSDVQDNKPNFCNYLTWKDKLQ
ncbi:tRNA (adenine(37)-N6)-methyltransferase [Glycine soja]